MTRITWNDFQYVTTSDGDTILERITETPYTMDDAMRDAMQPETVIVTRHAGAVEWLEGICVYGRVIAHATADDVRGKIVIGALPFHLAALATRVGIIDLPGLTAEQRGRDLTVEEMNAAGAALVFYTVNEVE